MRVHVLLIHHDPVAVVYGVYRSIELATQALLTRQAQSAQGDDAWFSITSVTLDVDTKDGPA